MSKTIFITIPAYEDQFLERTIREAVENAKNPENLFFAIALQYKEIPIPDLSKFSGPNFKYISYDVDTRPGVNIVRHVLSKMYNGEDLFLMIDSHMLFAKDWDQLLISEYEEIQNRFGEKVIWSQGLPERLGCPITNVVYRNWVFSETDLPVEPSGQESWPYLLYDDVKDKKDFITVNTKYHEAMNLTCHFFLSSGEFLSDVGINQISNVYEEEPFIYYSSYISGWKVFNIQHNNVIAHDNKEYDRVVYGEDLVFPGKAYSSSRDSYNNVVAINLSLLFNEGPAKVKNAVMHPKDFYENFGLLDKYLKVAETYKNSYEELLEIANKAINKKFLQ